MREVSSLQNKSKQLFDTIASYEPEVDPYLFQQAFQLMIRGHSNVNRASGEPFFEHPIHVAELLVQKRMDSSTVIAGLLHDLVEDTSTPIEYIKEIFGNDIANLVNGVTKIKISEKRMAEWIKKGAKIRKRQQLEKETKQFQSFRKLLIASLEDPRVLIIKLADRVHNIKTLNAIEKKEKRQRIARETIDVYVPLATRMGIEDWKNTLTRHAFSQLYPKEDMLIKEMLQNRIKHEYSLVDKIATELKEELLNSGAPNNISVVGRLKEPYSIWLKCKEKNIKDISAIVDVIAFRILCDNPDQCYFLLGLLHSLYKHKPETFRDYISVPKLNGYRSLHTGIFGPFGHLVELQIRTFNMQEINDFGPAAHWRYKEGIAPNFIDNPLQAISELLNSSSDNPADFFNNTRQAIGDEQMQIFTPEGKIITIPPNSTVLDFAFNLHTDIGLKCSGAKINGRTSSIRATLKNGDIVEILSDNNISPSYNWLNFTKTPKATAIIRRFLNQRQRENKYQMGRQILSKLANKSKISDDELISLLPAVAAKMGLPSSETIYSLIGEQKINPDIVIHHAQVMNSSMNAPLRINKTWKPEVKVNPCCKCKPIPGDQIVGVPHPQFGIIAHLNHCIFLEKTKSMAIIKMKWRSNIKKIYPVVIAINMKNSPGVLAKCCKIIGKMNINIQKIDFLDNSEVSQLLNISMEVSNIKKLNKVISDMEKIDSIYSISRS